MKFGLLPVAESEGVFLAHAIRKPGLTLKKGEWIGAVQIAALQAADVAEIVAACIEPGEVDENTAALSLACSIAGANLHLAESVTGRCNLIANCAGILVVDAAVIDRVNMVDEAITLVTLAPFRRVTEGEMIVTARESRSSGPPAAPVRRRKMVLTSSSTGFLLDCRCAAKISAGWGSAAF
ncbi:hypothetical protein QEV83_08235 [Methylocapsa sp. D3K7]|uniref:hypothetical protein n=1 Tax=Methylocapsa sp. D3K7 TaxID=3041435 RepID=UPI00244EF560|nr:hypothetical protein [Methylocapsa sp. D3K7]WGJ16215.1 hypothetical protein QEV83_08235 [Methylocapsa sp. D3K7]